MSEEPAVSVIIPTHDRPRFLAEAIASVLAQRRLPEQLIVVDDGGAGEVSEALQASGGPRAVAVSVVRGPGRGPGAARNVGLAQAEGELVAFLDDDDVWHPAKLELQVQQFAAAPSLGVLGTGIASGTRPPPRASAVSRGKARPVPFDSLLKANRLPMSSVVARRACLAECEGFDESLELAQDWDLWLRAALRWPVAMLEAPLVGYRRHGGQRSADAQAMRWWEGEVLRRVLARGLPGPRLEAIARRRLAWSQVRLGKLLSGAGEAELARQRFREAVRLSRWSLPAWLGLMRCSLTAGAPARAGS
ncbi:MAG: glycosyltransferase family 2 protein [Armatimonadota bacterium]